MAGGVSCGGDAGLEASAAEVVVVTNQTLETTATEVSLEAGVARDSFVTGHCS